MKGQSQLPVNQFSNTGGAPKLPNSATLHGSAGHRNRVDTIQVEGKSMQVFPSFQGGPLVFNPSLNFHIVMLKQDTASPCTHLNANGDVNVVSGESYKIHVMDSEYKMYSLVSCNPSIPATASHSLVPVIPTFGPTCIHSIPTSNVEDHKSKRAERKRNRQLNKNEAKAAPEQPSKQSVALPPSVLTAVVAKESISPKSTDNQPLKAVRSDKVRNLGKVALSENVTARFSDSDDADDDMPLIAIATARLSSARKSSSSPEVVSTKREKRKGEDKDMNGDIKSNKNEGAENSASRIKRNRSSNNQSSTSPVIYANPSGVPPQKKPRQEKIVPAQPQCPISSDDSSDYSDDMPITALPRVSTLPTAMSASAVTPPPSRAHIPADKKHSLKRSKHMESTGAHVRRLPVVPRPADASKSESD